MGSHNVQGTDDGKGEVMYRSIVIMLSVITEVHQAVANGQAILLINQMTGCSVICFFHQCALLT